MSDSKRLATLKAYTAYLEAEVSVANGYQHDLAGVVFRGRNKFTANDPKTMVSILEAPDSDRNNTIAGEESGAGESSEQWLWLVQGWTPDDKQHPTDPAYNLMADVKKATSKLANVSITAWGGSAVGDNNVLLGGLIDGITCDPGVVRPPDEATSEAFFWMRVRVEFHEDPADPYKLN